MAHIDPGTAEAVRRCEVCGTKTLDGARVKVTEIIELEEAEIAFT